MLSFVAAASGSALGRSRSAWAPRLGRAAPPPAAVAGGRRARSWLSRLGTTMSASSSAGVAPSPSPVPTWADLEGALPADALEPDYVNGVSRASPSWEEESLRLYGKERKDVRMILYRDTAYWCPYVGLLCSGVVLVRVWLVLACTETGIL